ncbi:hypothetical protein J0910_30410 [Nocardiopsis sp. CNT-189]|uniref:hypothetical protein n=1 Tax=Nocardiopsis oceanisediminis TaxID=2816862 RepID=UPI003B38E465
MQTRTAVHLTNATLALSLVGMIAGSLLGDPVWWLWTLWAAAALAVAALNIWARKTAQL